MKPRLVIIVIAIILGLITALGVSNYLNNIRRQAVEEHKTIQVWVAKSDIEKGTSIEDIIKSHLAELRKVPRRYVASQAISSTRGIEGEVLSVPISAGEQLTISRFKHPSEAGLSYTVPKGFIAVSIPYDDNKGVAGMIKPGDLVAIFATFTPGADGDNITKLLLQKVQVIAVGVDIGTGKDSAKANGVAAVSTTNAPNGGQKTVTLALSAADSERLVFAQENGKIYLGLYPTANPDMSTTGGMTVKTIFK